jgi:hypothetical protein
VTVVASNFHRPLTRAPVPEATETLERAPPRADEGVCHGFS